MKDITEIERELENMARDEDKGELDEGTTIDNQTGVYSASNGYGTAESASFMGDGTGSSESRDNYLKITGDGFWGFIESININIKLIVIIGVCVAGFVALGSFLMGREASQVHNAKLSKSFQELSSNMGNLIRAVQAERATSMIFLATSINETEKNENTMRTLQLQYKETDNWMSRLRRDIEERKLKKYEEMEGELAAMNSTYYLIKQYRDGIVTRKLDTLFGFYYYNAFIVPPMLGLLGKYVLLGGKDPTISSYLLSMRILEIDYSIKSTGEIAGIQKLMSVSRFRSFVKFQGQYDENIASWLSTTDKKFTDKYQKLIPKKLRDDIKVMVEYSLAPQNGTATNGALFYAIPNFNATQWLLYYDAKIEGMKIIERDLASHMESTTQKKFAQSVGIIVAVCVLIALLAIISSTIIILGVKSIAGPWRRLNIIQEAAVTKFVPTGLLRLIKCNSVANASAGMKIKMPLAFISFKIDNMNAITKNLNDNEIMTKLNNYVGNLDGIIRSNKGTIQKYKTDGCGFLATFTERFYAVKAAIQINNALEKNSNSPTKPSVGIGVHSGQEILIGIVGSNNRLESAIIGDDGALTSKMEDIAVKMETGVLVTWNTIEGAKLGDENNKKVDARWIGSLPYVDSNGLTRDMKIYEMLDGERSKKKITKKQFEKGVRKYSEGKYWVASNNFYKIVETDNTDSVARAYTVACQYQMRKITETQKEADFDTLMANETIVRAFKEFCVNRMEPSIFALWEQVKAYRESVDSELRTTAESLWESYISETADHKVEIPRNIRESISYVMKSDERPQRDLFGDLQRELKERKMRKLMENFKATEEFSNAFRSSSLSRESTDLLTICEFLSKQNEEIQQLQLEQ